MTTRTVRSLATLFVAFALIAAACGSDSDDETATDSTESTDTSTPTDTESTDGSDPEDTTPEPDAEDDTPTLPPDVELFASFEGVTADSIKVGVVAADLDELRELGLVDINNGDIPLIYETYVNQVNDNGGVLGRQIELVYTEYNPVFNASAEEACVLLTQDEQVFITLGGIAGPAIDSVLCFVETNNALMLGGTHTPAHFPRATAPWLALTAAADRRHQATLELYDQEGLLEGNIGVFDDSSEADAISNGVVIPALEGLGYEVTTHVTSNIPQGDEVALAESVRTFAERLDQDNIDTLVIVQSQIALGLALIREAGYDGNVVVVDTGTQLNTIGSLDERDPRTYEGAYGPMGMTDDEIWADEAVQECITTLTDANPEIEVKPAAEVADGEPAWLTGLIEPCRLVQTFDRIAEGAGADLNPDTWLASAESLGTFALPARPFNSYAAGKQDADDNLRLGVFDPTVGENGALVPVTDLQDIG